MLLFLPSLSATIYLFHSPPLICDLAQGKQTSNAKALTTEFMDTHTQQRETFMCEMRSPHNQWESQP